MNILKHPPMQDLSFHPCEEVQQP